VDPVNGDGAKHISLYVYMRAFAVPTYQTIYSLYVIRALVDD